MATKNTTPIELPMRPYYTLEQAAKELNRHFQRDDVDVDYFIQLYNHSLLNLYGNPEVLRSQVKVAPWLPNEIADTNLLLKIHHKIHVTDQKTSLLIPFTRPIKTDDYSQAIVKSNSAIWTWDVLLFDQASKKYQSVFTGEFASLRQGNVIIIFADGKNHNSDCFYEIDEALKSDNLSLLSDSAEKFILSQDLAILKSGAFDESERPDTNDLENLTQRARKDKAILATLAKLDLNPHALPDERKGEKGSRSKVWDTMDAGSKQKFFQSSVKIFQEHWQRMIGSEQIISPEKL